MIRYRILLAVAGLALSAALAGANAQQKPPAAPAKPYKAVIVSPAAELNDADLTALRDKVGQAIKSRDPRRSPGRR